MLSDLDFVIIGYCSKCGNPKYQHFENGIYYSCLCLFRKLPVRKLKLNDKPSIVKKDNPNQQEEKELYGKSS
jgi:hypothetical protein